MSSVSSFDDMTLLYRRFLRLIGLLPLEGRRDFANLGSRLHLAYCLYVSLIHWSMFGFYLISKIKELPIDTLCEVVSVTGVTIRYYLLIPWRLELAKLLDESRVIWELCDEEGRREVRRFERKMRPLFHFLLGSGYFASFMYCVSAVFATYSSAAHPQNGTYERFLPFKWFSEDGPNLWPGYYTIFLLQVLLTVHACLAIATVDSAAPFLIMMGAGYFRALRLRLLRVPDNEQELVACTRMHQRILHFCQRIDQITRSLFFTQLLCSGYNISLVGLKIVSSDPDRYKYFPFVLLNLGQLFICEWAPDHLINESLAISSAAYFASFIWIRHRLGKMPVLIMARSQRPVQITAAGVVHLSLENFNSMLTSAASFFTMLRSFNL